MPLFSMKTPGGLSISRHMSWAPEGNPKGGISLVEVYERGGKYVISGGKKAQKGQQIHFMAVKSGENVLILSFIGSLKIVHLQQLKGGGGVPFLSKMVYKMVSGWI